ncbi:MAG TPA: hypothetical protein VGV69_04675 [Solirubrobacterales bacterium]|nr:hypothetical protein [Solirubrobacterales bacterium]
MSEEERPGEPGDPEESELQIPEDGEPEASGEPRPAAEIPVDPKGEPAPEKSENSAGWLLKGAVLALVPVAAFIVATEWWHPSAEASFDTSRPTPSSIVELSDAALETPLEASIGSFSISQIPPLGKVGPDGYGKKLLIRLRVAEQSCEELEARIGGSCGGGFKPALRQPERFSMRTEGGALEAFVSTTSAEAFEIGQNAEPEQPGPSREWSLTENAAKTEVKIRCLGDTSLEVTLLPGEAHPRCSPDGVFYRLLIVNRRNYPPILSFTEVSALKVETDGRRVELTANDGALDLDGVEREVPALAPTPVTLEAAEGELVHLKLAPPGVPGAPTVSLSSPKVDEAFFDDQSTMPSWLDRHSRLETLVYGVLLSLFTTVLVNLVIVVWRR